MDIKWTWPRFILGGGGRKEEKVETLIRLALQGCAQLYIGTWYEPDGQDMNIHKSPYSAEEEEGGRRKEEGERRAPNKAGPMRPPLLNGNGCPHIFTGLEYSGASVRGHTYFPVVQCIGLQYSVLSFPFLLSITLKTKTKTKLFHGILTAVPKVQFFYCKNMYI